jgi:hypothetical protein
VAVSTGVHSKVYRDIVEQNQQNMFDASAQFFMHRTKTVFEATDTLRSFTEVIHPNLAVHPTYHKISSITKEARDIFVFPDGFMHLGQLVADSSRIHIPSQSVTKRVCNFSSSLLHTADSAFKITHWLQSRDFISIAAPIYSPVVIAGHTVFSGAKGVLIIDNIMEMSKKLTDEYSHKDEIKIDAQRRHLASVKLITNIGHLVIGLLGLIGAITGYLVASPVLVMLNVIIVTTTIISFFLEHQKQKAEKDHTLKYYGVPMR